MIQIEQIKIGHFETLEHRLKTEGVPCYVMRLQHLCDATVFFEESVKLLPLGESARNADDLGPVPASWTEFGSLLAQGLEELGQTVAIFWMDYTKFQAKCADLNDELLAALIRSAAPPSAPTVKLFLVWNHP